MLEIGLGQGILGIDAVKVDVYILTSSTGGLHE
jgi:hypothetical protein